MLGFSHFNITGAGDRRIRLLQINGVKQASAIVALIPAGFLITAMRADALNIAVREKALIVNGIDLPV